MINKIIGECRGIMTKLNTSKKFQNENSRKILMNSHILSRIYYFAPFISGESKVIKEKVNKLMNDAVRFI